MMKHLSVKITKKQSDVIISLMKKNPWIKMTTNKDIVYFPEDNLIQLYLIINSRNKTPSNRSMITKLTKLIKGYKEEYQQKIYKKIKEGEAEEALRLEKELEEYRRKLGEEIKKSERLSENVVKEKKVNKKEEEYDLVMMKVYDL